MSATKDKMMKAKQLIQAQKYPEARRILESVDHPTAQKWLAQLDDIELGDPFENAAPRKQKQPLPGNNTPPDDLPNFRYLLYRDIISLLLFPLSLLWITYDARRAERAVKQYGAEAVPGAMAMIYFNRITFGLLLFILLSPIAIVILQNLFK